MPSVPSYPRERTTTKQGAPTREYESFEQYDSGALLLAAGTVFQEVITFSGRPDSLTVDVEGTAVEVRLRNRGQAAFQPIRLLVGPKHELRMGAEIVEARDPTGAGGQRVIVLGRFSSRHIDVRNNRPGPRRRSATYLEEHDGSGSPAEN